MDFELTDRERMLKESVDRLLADRYSFTQRKSYQSESRGWSKSVWQSFAELGLLGLPFPEEVGGFGGSAAELMAVMEAFGRHLVVEPYLSTVILGGGLIQLGGTAAQREELLPRLIEGELLLALAHEEAETRYDLANIAATARRDGAQWILNGSKCHVLHGGSAHKLLISARISGKPGDEDGIALFLVEADAKGLSRQDYTTQDGIAASDITVRDLAVPAENLIGEAGQAFPLIERVTGNALAATAMETVGAMSVSYEMTLDYLKTRQQFGTVIGKFQALQHRLADMVVELEMARGMAMFAGMMVDDQDVQKRRKALSSAKVQIGRSARFVGQQAIQLHGGIGMTTEYALGAYFKRITYLNLQFGDADHHLSRLAREDGRNSL